MKEADEEGRRYANHLPAGEEQLEGACERDQLRAGGKYTQQREEPDEACLFMKVGHREAGHQRGQDRRKQRNRHRDAVDEEDGWNHKVADSQPVGELDVAAHGLTQDARVTAEDNQTAENRGHESRAKQSGSGSLGGMRVRKQDEEPHAGDADEGGQHRQDDCGRVHVAHADSAPTAA